MCVCVSPVYVSICHTCTYNPRKSEGIVRSPGSGVTDSLGSRVAVAMWVLRVEPGSSGRAAGALNC